MYSSHVLVFVLDFFSLNELYRNVLFPLVLFVLSTVCAECNCTSLYYAIYGIYGFQGVCVVNSDIVWLLNGVIVHYTV